MEVIILLYNNRHSKISSFASLQDVLVFMCSYNSINYFDVNDVSNTSNIENDVIYNITEQLSTSCTAKRPFIDIKYESLDDVPSTKRIDFKQDPDAIGLSLVKETGTIPLIATIPKIEIKSEDFDEEISAMSAIDNTELEDATPSFLMTPKVEIKSEYFKNDFHEHDIFTEEVTTTSDINNDEQTVQYLSVSERHTFCKKYEYVMKKELMLRSYHRSNMFFLGFNSSIYKDAVKNIDIIDVKGSFTSSILKEVHDLVGDRGFERFSIDLSKTYSNVCEYILHKVYPYLDDIVSTSDVVITPGMSVSDIKCNCVLNHIFFEKLRESCEKIIQDMIAVPDYYLLNIFQSYIVLDYYSGAVSKRYKFFISSKNKDVFCSKLKELIIETIYNLPRSIIWEIENFGQYDIVNATFSDVHGVFLSKSSIRDLIYFFNSTKNEIPSANFDDNLDLFGSLLEKVECLVRKSCIFYKGEVFLPDKSMVDKLSRYLLSDMYGISTNFYKGLKLSSKNISELKKSNTSENIDLLLPKLDLSTTNSIAVNNEIKISNKYSACKTLQQCATSKKLEPGRYNYILWYVRFTGSIYEDAIKKMNIDSEGLFRDSVSDEMINIIKNRGLSRSSIDLSLTYSNVRKYVLDKISTHVNNIIAVEDILITAGMSISEIRYSCTSNHAFFKKLHESCEKIVEGIRVIPENVFLDIIQSYIRFNLDFRVRITCKKSKLCLKIKELIIETISNLPQSIIFEIEKFEESDIVKGLFLCVHGVLILKSSVRNVKSFLNSEKKIFSNGNFNDSTELFDKLLASLVSILKTSVIFLEGKVILPDVSTVDLLSRCFLLDMYKIHGKLHKNICDENTVELHRPGSFKGTSIVSYNVANTEIQSPKDEDFFPKSNRKWNPDLITFLNIYELVISMIDIDKGKVEFEDYFLSKIKLISPAIAKFGNESKIRPDLSVTYGRVKNYILEIFVPFLKKNEKETKVKIELYHGMSLDKLVFAYRSNEKFFTKLRSFCNEVITHIRNRSDSILIGMMQSFVYLYIETDLPKVVKRVSLIKHKNIFSKCVLELLFRNISSIPEMVVDSIILLPPSKLVDEYFSLFYNTYVDNKSLLKAKLVFNVTKQKIMSDVLLSELVNKISSDMVCKFGFGMRKNLYRFINGYIVCENLSTLNYIRKLVREEFSAFRVNLTDPIMIIRHDKVEIADQEMRCEILSTLESDLITSSIKSYIKLCTDQYNLKSK